MMLILVLDKNEQYLSECKAVALSSNDTGHSENTFIGPCSFKLFAMMNLCCSIFVDNSTFLLTSTFALSSLTPQLYSYTVGTDRDLTCLLIV